MPFLQESTGYEKTILSELQSAWSLLRSSVVEAAGFEGWDRAIFHIDEAMSWDTVRNPASLDHQKYMYSGECTGRSFRKYSRC